MFETCILGPNSLNYSDESMIVNSNPSTPEHLKSNLLNTDQTSSGVDMNCNQLNHSQPQQLSLTHNHNYSYNQYFNNINNNNMNNRNQTNMNQNSTGLVNYEMEATDPNDLNPMDFIDNDIPTPDETLFNLDTFDILGDIDNLDDLSQTNNSSNYRNTNLNQIKTIKSESSATISSAQEYRELSASITDYSPEWCYPEGIAL